MKQQHLLFRVLGNQPQAIAQDVCEFIQRFPGLRDKGVKLFVKTAVDPEDNTLAYDVFMETDSGEDIDLAHEAEMEYFQGRELHKKVLARYTIPAGENKMPSPL